MLFPLGTCLTPCYASIWSPEAQGCWGSCHRCQQGGKKRRSAASVPCQGRRKVSVSCTVSAPVVRSCFWPQVGTAVGKKGEDWEYEENPADDDQDMGEGDGDEGGASPSVAARWATAVGRAAHLTGLEEVGSLLPPGGQLRLYGQLKQGCLATGLE